jgi:hypothetical protein
VSKKIGLLSDTHSYLDPKIKEYFMRIKESALRKLIKQKFTIHQMFKRVENLSKKNNLQLNKDS